MAWRCSQSEYRRRYLARVDAAEAARYDDLVGHLGPEDQEAYLQDLQQACTLKPGAAVLDAGAGTGTVSSLLARFSGLSITALEPSPALLGRLAARAELSAVEVVEGFCDAPEDRNLFPAARFDAIVSRQLANGLFDPLAAFRNWHHWLVPSGTLVVIDGLYGRAAWSGAQEGDVDRLPLAAVQGMALIPYLLETAGFHVDAVQPMRAVNARPGTKTPRYLVAATKASGR
ncbi:MAG TPA: class I SAM-dependent methyltransferase [Steroidobacteraceae bacterium]|nr:class I SAM-dependent methyltransferase [Steroidobacteraceae bacterium]